MGVTEASPRKSPAQKGELVQIAACDVVIGIDVKASTVTIPIKINVADIVGNIPINIAAATIGNVPIDIKAQSVGNVNINIAAQSGPIDINLYSTSITLNVNLAPTGSTYYVFFYDLVAIKTTSTSEVLLGTKNLLVWSSNISSLRGGVQGRIFSGTGPGWLKYYFNDVLIGTFEITSTSTQFFDTKVFDYASVSAMRLGLGAGAWPAPVDTVKIKGYVTAGSELLWNGYSLSGACQSEALRVSINAAELNLPIDIVAQTLAQLNINLAASAITLNVNLSSQSVDINIKTSGGANIVIDKLTQTAVYERRTGYIQNDNGISSGSPPDSDTGVAWRGKVFPRGMRGMLLDLAVYCRRTGSGTLTLAYAPYPGMGEVGSVVITPGADWAWQGTVVRKMWNYDSMFIWIKACSADVSHGYDGAEPSDRWLSDDSGVTWYSFVGRHYIKVNIQAQTVGDLPVSGTLNTIDLPSQVTGSGIVGINELPALTSQYDTERFGSGRILWVMFDPVSTTGRDDMCPRLTIDGTEIFSGIFYATVDWFKRVKEASKGLFFGNYNDTDQFWTMIIMLNLPFRRSFKVGYYNKNTVEAQSGNILYFWEKIA